MSHYVLKFKKEGYMRYISHLDIARLFRRSFSRINIRLKHSEGFNPHPKMSFAQPLSLGYESTGEYLEFETSLPQEPEKMKEALNAVLPQGIAVLAVRPEEGKKAVSARVFSASYDVWLRNIENVEEFCAQMREFLAQPEILRQRKQKNGKFVAQDIRPMILQAQAEVKSDQTAILHLRLAAGSNNNLNPEVFVKCLYEFAGSPYDPQHAGFCRRDMYFQSEDGAEIPII